MNLNEVLHNFTKVSWFPGHMHRGFRLIEQTIKKVDIFLEVRDARAPLSTFNRQLDDILKRHQKEKIVLFNKYDLCDPTRTQVVIDELNELGILNLKVSSKQRRYDFQDILRVTRVARQEKFQTVGLWMMVGGVPNVGKSNVINNLRVLSKDFRNNQVQKSHSKACLTTSVNGFKISENPKTWLMDSPGLLLPNLETKEKVLILGALGSIKASIVGPSIIVQYLYHAIGPRGRDVVVKKYGLQKHPESYEELLVRISSRFKHNSEAISIQKFLKDFQAGTLGRYTLDDVYGKLES